MYVPLPQLLLVPHLFVFFFFFNDTATTEIYTLSLHDALPISRRPDRRWGARASGACPRAGTRPRRSEEHTSELQSQSNLVCRLLLEKKKKKRMPYHQIHEQDGPTSFIRHTAGVSYLSAWVPLH